MNKIINSPIVITIIVIIAAFVIKSQMKAHLGSEIRGAYEEIISIAEDASSDVEKTKAIQDFAQQISTQLRAGFSSGFSPNEEDGEESKESKFLRTKTGVKLGGIKEVPSQFSGRQSFIFSISNGSDYAVKSIMVNFDYYRDGVLIDTTNERLNEIEILDLGERVNLKEDRSILNKLSEEEQIAFTFDQVKASITSFRIVEN